MVRPKRVDQNTDLNADIKAAAWQQIQERGAAALSLRGIARQVGIAAPSIYHYYPNRVELVTALIVEAFNALAESQRQALRATPGGDPAPRLTALALAYRQWAVSHAQRYLLLFGTPIPGYAAPEAITLPAATAGLVPLAEVLQAALAAGRLRLDSLAPLTPALQTMLEAWQRVEGRSHVDVLYLALVFWSRMHGLMMFEINGQYPAFITDAGEVFAREMSGLVKLYFNEGKPS